MAFSVTLKNLGAFSGASNLQLFLRKTSDNSLLNAGGDTGSDASSIGSFTWTIAEDRPSEQMLARIYEGSTETAANIIIDSVLNVGFTEIGEGVVELDPASRVKLDASQPDYAPATAAAVAAEAVKTAAIKLKTDNLPSDPADQSQVEIYLDGVVASIQGSQQTAAAAALVAYDPPTNAEMEARTLVSASYATATALTAVRTFIRKLFQLALRKDAAIATDNATELTELNANGGSGGGTYSNTTDAQEAIRDRGDAAWSAQSVSPALVVSPVYPGGKIVLKAGDDYSDEITTTISLPVSDASEAVYNRLTDSSTSAIKFAAGRNREKDLIVGTVTKASVTKSAGVTYVPIQIARTQITTAKVFNDYKYDIQVTTSGGKITTPVGGELEVEFDNAE